MHVYVPTSGKWHEIQIYIDVSEQKFLIQQHKSVVWVIMIPS